LSRPEFDIVVIGGGAGGLVVAAGGAALGAKVALVDRHRLGGDCLWYGCVPSKALIQSARIAHTMRHAERWALRPADPAPDLAQVMERVRGVIAGIEPNDSPERFRALGVDVTFGDGRFTAPDAFEIAGRRLTGTTFVLATGSRPAVPDIPGLTQTPYLTNETLFDLREAVPSLLVVGAGPVGCELAQAMRRLGSEVTIVDAAARILAREDADVVQVVAQQLRDDGIRFCLDAKIRRVAGPTGAIMLTVVASDGRETVLTGTHLLLAAGRRANIEGLGLDAAGVPVADGHVVVDDKLRSSNRRIFAIGDVIGGYQFTHVAEHHAGIVLRHAIFRLGWAKPSRVVPWCTYTDPELARVGLSEADAQERRIPHRIYRFPFADIDRARTDGETLGFAKLVTDPKGRMLGAAIVGARAGDLIAECVLAIGNGLRAEDIAAAIHAYPTMSQVARRAADQRAKARLTPSARRWIQRIFRLRGGWHG